MSTIEQRHRIQVGDRVTHPELAGAWLVISLGATAGSVHLQSDADGSLETVAMDTCTATGRALPAAEEFPPPLFECI